MLHFKKRHPVVIPQYLAQSLRDSWGSSNLSYMSFGHTNVEICNTSCFENIKILLITFLSGVSTDAVCKVSCKWVKFPGRS